MSVVSYPAVVILIYLWIGFVCAISFMEAGLKFRAPGITLPLGLSIGQLVFKALHRIEWVLAMAVNLNFLMFSQGSISWRILWFSIPVVILILQAVWALPALNRRAVSIIEGRQLPPSRLHYYYIGLDLVKVSSLFVFGILQFQ